MQEQKPTRPHDAIRSIVVSAPRGRRAIGLKELWSYRELAYFLAWRDVKVRYKQAAVGVAWVLLQPLAMIALFSILFQKVAVRPADDSPYALFVLTALLPWQFFSRVISESTTSLITDQRLVTRVYFPRLVVPIGTAMAALVDFVISMFLVAGLMLISGIRPDPWALLIPIPFLLMIAAALGSGFWLAALNVEYRDVMHAVPFLVQLWFFATPVIYSVDVVPDRWRWLMAINPMTAVAEGFRACLMGGEIQDGLVLGISATVSVVLLLTGAVWFRFRETVFVDSLGSTGI
jgi:lipopolysaccharide transport system permease protein